MTTRKNIENVLWKACDAPGMRIISQVINSGLIEL
jgi:hypothetical protein